MVLFATFVGIGATQTVKEIAVKRPSVAYGFVATTEYAADEARTKQICLSPRPTVSVSGLEIDGETFSANGLDKAVLVARGEMVLLCETNSTGVELGKLYSTADGVTFVTEIDTFSGSLAAVFADSAQGSVKAATILSDGSWVVNIQGGVTPVPGGLTDRVGSRLYRKPAGGSWAKVLDIPLGGVPNWGFNSDRDNEVVCVSYGSYFIKGSTTVYADPPQPSEVYYSDDYGASWTEIFSIDEGHRLWGAWGVHGHAVTFHPSDTDVIYVSYGDSPFAEIIKLTHTSGSKKDSANWTETYTGLNVEPTSVCTDGRYLYWGQDASVGQSTVMRHDPTDDTGLRCMRSLARGKKGVAAENQVNYPYYERGIGGSMIWCFGLEYINGVFYAGAQDQETDAVIGKVFGGVLVSRDGLNWTYAWRRASGTVWKIAGEANGSIWGWWRDADGRSRVLKMPAVAPYTVRATQAEEGATNLLSASRSHFDGGAGWSTDANGWMIYATDHDDGVIATSTEEALYGTHSLKVTCEDNNKGYLIIKLPDLHRLSLASVNGGTGAADGDLLCFSLHYKLGTDFPKPKGVGNKFLIVRAFSDGVVGTGAAGLSMFSEGMMQPNISFKDSDGWTRLQVWVRLTGVATGFRPAFRVTTDGLHRIAWAAGEYNEGDERRNAGKNWRALRTTSEEPTGTPTDWESFDDFGDLAVYFDCLSVTHHPKRSPSTDWYPGGATRSDEYGVVSMVDLGEEWATSFVWTPEGSDREWYDDIAIATWLGASGEYIKLFYDASEGKLTLTDGTNTVASTAAVQWEFLDNLKFVLSHSADGVNLFAETPLHGIITLTSGDITLGVPHATLLFNADETFDVAGRGLFSNLIVYDETKDATGAAAIFDDARYRIPQKYKRTFAPGSGIITLGGE